MRLALTLLAAISFAPSGEDPELTKAGEKMVPELISLLIHPQYYLHSVERPAGGWATDTLKAIGGPAVPGLIQALQADNEQTRENATDALQSIKAKEALPALRAAYASAKEGYPRRRLLDAIAEIGRGESVDFILQTIDPEKEESIEIAISALSLTGDSAAIPTLAKYLTASPAKEGKDVVGLDRSAAFALADLGALAQDVLAKAFRDGGKRMRMQAGDAIMTIDDPKCSSLVIEVLTSSTAFELNCSYAGLLPDDKGVSDTVWSMLESPKLKTQLTAARLFEMSMGKVDADTVNRILIKSCRMDPGDDPKHRRELLLRLARMSMLAGKDWQRMPQKPKEIRAIRHAIEWMLANGYSGGSLAPIVESYCDAPDIEAAELLVKLAQEKTPEDKIMGGGGAEGFALSVEYEAAGGCGKIGAPAMVKLRDAWKKGLVSDSIYGTAIFWTDDPKAFNLVEEAAKSQNPKLRGNAARALGEFKNDRVVPLLLGLLKDPETKDEASSSLIGLVHEETIKSVARSESIPYDFESIIKDVPEPLLQFILNNGSRPARVAAAIGMIEAKRPGGTSLFFNLAKDAKDDDRQVVDAISYSIDDEALLRRFLAVKSLRLRALAYCRLKGLLEPPAKRRGP